MDRIGLCVEARSRGKSRFPVRDTWSERAQDCGSHWPLGRQEKPLARIILRPYRKPTLVGRGKSPQVNERPSVKELGKLTPYLRKKGCPSSEVWKRIAGGGCKKLAQPTVYQKHRSLRTRKRKYRG